MFQKASQREAPFIELNIRMGQCHVDGGGSHLLMLFPKSPKILLIDDVPKSPQRKAGGKDAAMIRARRLITCEQVSCEHVEDVAPRHLPDKAAKYGAQARIADLSTP